MKHTSFERVEKVHGDLRTEEVVVHSRKRHGYWKLKIWSVILAFLIWLIMTGVHEAKNTPQLIDAGLEPAIEQTVV